MKVHNMFHKNDIMGDMRFLVADHNKQTLSRCAGKRILQVHIEVTRDNLDEN